jgi:hypothetical protein
VVRVDDDHDLSTLEFVLEEISHYAPSKGRPADLATAAPPRRRRCSYRDSWRSSFRRTPTRLRG